MKGKTIETMRTELISMLLNMTDEQIHQLIIRLPELLKSVTIDAKQEGREEIGNSDS